MEDGSQGIDPPLARVYPMEVKREYIGYHTFNRDLRGGNRDEALESR